MLTKIELVWNLMKFYWFTIQETQEKYNNNEIQYMKNMAK